MKNLLIVFLLFPILAFSQNQYGIKNCHTDLVLGFDYGNFINGSERVSTLQVSPIYSFRFGTNLNYPIADRWQLVTGIRLANKSYTQDDFDIVEDPTFPNTLQRIRTNDVYAEIPFKTRFMVKTFNRDSRWFIEGGLQFNFYTFTLQKRTTKAQSGEELYEKSLEREGDYNTFHLSSNFAVGFEYDVKPNVKYFVQPVGRFQLLPTFNNSNVLSYHIGLEMGLRF